MALTCETSKQGEGCNVCESCIQLQKSNTNRNYIEHDAATNNSVEDVRKLIDNSNIAIAGTARRRVVLLDEAHQLSKAAQNALLKLFEEGSPSTIYMLATTEPEKLLGTIRGRAIRYKVLSATKNDIVDRLIKISNTENVKFDKKALELITTVSKGHVRDAITLLEMIAMTGDVTVESTSQYLELDQDTEIAKIITLMAEDNIFEFLRITDVRLLLFLRP